ncbi:hypothetical protein Pla52o_46840 [Novipirellula galeiformis]|uniref:Uncharacterized protein n=1 Tax=Novipirellula galeiformis TaxID=2528004 RepID=A0A5C6CBG9_9BACT|nr:hypothetical protein Pla52o_46840 [Novipirellula galeiformis]
MTKRKRLTKVVVVATVVTLLGIVGWHTLRAITAFMFLSALGELSDEGPLFGLEHRSVETIGQFTDSDAESNYNFVANGTGISFPDGTVLDQHDDSWGQVSCCFQLPTDAILPMIPSDRFGEPLLTSEETTTFPDLSEANRKVPALTKRYDTTSLINSHSVTLYVHPGSNRVWVAHRYPSPMD